MKLIRVVWRGRHNRLRSPGPAGVSRTGQAVALMRAKLDRPCGSEGDPDAQRRLCAGMPPLPAGATLHSLVARTRFFDEQVIEATQAGVPQVVICGAGYDDRALRFARRGVRFFELDHPTTQADKARRLVAMGADAKAVTLAALDFGRDRVDQVLDQCGHDATKPTLFLCEGLLVYLERDTCHRLLAGLRDRAAAGSTLAASLAVHSTELDSDAVTRAANARRAHAGKEPWRTILPPEAHLALVSAAGWKIERNLDAATLDSHAISGRTLLVQARA